MVIAKFGGSSVGTPEALTRVGAILERRRRPTVAVVSALSGVTDALLAAARHASRHERVASDAIVEDLRARHAGLLETSAGQLAREAAEPELERIWVRLTALLRHAEAERHCSHSRQDAIASTGELASSRIIVDVLRAHRVPAVWVDARRVVVTDETHTAAVPNLDATRRNARRALAPIVAAGRVPVLGGFIGATPEGVTTTLGRGGSDWSASVLGACLDADEIQIWTDVDGVYSADPRRDPRARRFDRLSFGDAERLARSGAKVLHPETISPAEAAGIPVRVLNTFNPGGAGTLITRDARVDAGEARSGPMWHRTMGGGLREVTA